MKTQETYYDLLKVAPNATISEIVAAYNSAKSTFARDSMATYSLFSEEETQDILAKLEEAFATLSNLDRKRAYDRQLEGGSGTEASLSTAGPTPLPQTVSERDLPVSSGTGGGALPTIVDGAFLESLRRARGLTVEDVARVTKIPTKFLKAIEGEQTGVLPARVYLQGFIKNLATLYKLEPTETAKRYVSQMDAKANPSET